MISIFRRHAAFIASVSICAFSIGGCASQYDYDPPKVDMKGVDEAKYQRDVDDCVDRKIGTGLAYNQPTITNCMRERGYTITGKGG